MMFVVAVLLVLILFALIDKNLAIVTLGYVLGGIMMIGLLLVSLGLMAGAFGVGWYLAGEETQTAPRFALGGLFAFITAYGIKEALGRWIES